MTSLEELSNTEQYELLKENIGSYQYFKSFERPPHQILNAHHKSDDSEL